MKFVSLFLRAGRIWLQAEAEHMSAALAYYVPFAITPLIVISVTLVGLVSGTERVQVLLYSWGVAIDPGLAELLQTSAQNFDQLTMQYSIPLLAVVFFSGMVIVALNSLARGLQRIWGVTLSGWQQYFGQIVRSLIFLLVMQGYILFVILQSEIFEWIVATTGLTIVNYLSGVLLFVSTAILTVFGYSVLSPRTPSLRARIYAALVASVLFMFSRLIVGFHLVTAPIPDLYGAAGIIIILLIWLYVAATIVFYGAAFAQAYDERYCRDNRLPINRR